MTWATDSARRKLFQAACASAAALAVSGCGGGGGGGIAYIPPPPPPPPAPTPPPPPPPPTAFTVSAPAPASIGASAAAPVFATEGGSNFTTGPTAETYFPILQSVMRSLDNKLEPDPDPNSSGRAIALGQTIEIDVPNFKAAALGSAINANLDWTRSGYWATGGGAWDYGDLTFRHAAFVFGYETPAAAVPTIGSATYTGGAEAHVFYPGVTSGVMNCGCVVERVSGTATFSADFGARTLSGSLAMSAQHPWYDPGQETLPWNSVAFSSTIAGNAFSGTTRVTDVGASPSSLSIGATGTVNGRFFGPAAQEAGAVWTLFDGVKAAIGTLTGRRP